MARDGPGRPALNLGLCELRTMSRPASEYPDDVTIYLVVNDFGSLGRAFVETDINEADRETVIRDFLSGQYSNALRVIAFNTAGRAVTPRLPVPSTPNSPSSETPPAMSSSKSNG